MGLAILGFCAVLEEAWNNKKNRLRMVKGVLQSSDIYKSKPKTRSTSSFKTFQNTFRTEIDIRTHTFAWGAAGFLAACFAFLASFAALRNQTNG